MAERRHVGPALGAADDGTRRDGDDGEQLVLLAMLATRVGEGGGSMRLLQAMTGRSLLDQHPGCPRSR